MRWFLLTLCAAMVGSFTVALIRDRRQRRTVIVVVNEGAVVGGWLAGTRVRSIDGRCGTVAAAVTPGTPPLQPHPVVRWDDGTRTRVNADTLTRATDDWFSRAVGNTEQM
jgi:hypothetical protein